VSSLFGFGGVRGREDAGLAEANRRQRLRMARDINDEATLARDGEPQIRRTRHWLWFTAAAGALGVFALIGGRFGHDVELTASCTTPSIGVDDRSVQAGAPIGYAVTGPQGARYVVTLDGTPVRGGGAAVDYTQTAAGPAITLQQCLGPTLLTAAPAGDGPHTLALLSIGADGRARQVAAVTVTVSGTP
jgi:hypothetical protein